MGQTASQRGEHASLVVLPPFASAGRSGVLRAVGQTPILLLALFAGAWVDRWRTSAVPRHWALRRPLRAGWRIPQGLHFVVRDTSLRTVCLASAAFQFSFAALMTVHLLFLPRELQLPGRFGPGAVLVSAAAIGDAAFLCVPALHGSSAVTVAAPLAAGFTFGAGDQLVNVMVMAVRQTVTPLARVFELLAGFRVNVRSPRRAVPASGAATTGRSVPSSPFSLVPLVPVGRWNRRHRGSWIPVFRAGFRCSASESPVGITPLSLPSLANLRFLPGKAGQVKIPPGGAIGVFRTLSVEGIRKSFLHIYDRKL